MIFRIQPKGKAFEVTVEDDSGVIASKPAKDLKEAQVIQKAAVKEGFDDWKASK